MSPTTAAERLADYRLWHRIQVKTGDIDPAYPVLRAITTSLSKDDAAWLVLTYAAYYHLGSAMRAFTELDPETLTPGAIAYLPKGTERRGHRDVTKLASHWNALRDQADAVGGPAAFLTPTASGVEGWRQIAGRALGVWGNGRWAAYKTAELAQKVLGADVTAPDAGHAFSTGPRKGLALLYRIPEGNSATVVNDLDRLTERLAAEIGEPDIAQVETSLCDYHSAYAGRHYIGKDIDEQLHQLFAVPSDWSGVAFNARLLSFPACYLGELNGWDNVDRARCRLYRDTGRIALRT